MGYLAWLLAVAGIGGVSLVFALSAPEPAWWVLALIVVALLAGPHLLQWRLSRARRTERLAARWWASRPAPVEVAFLCGGPDRVVDLVVADLVAEGRLAVDDDGRLAPAGSAVDEAGSPEAGFRREVLNRLSHGSTDVAALRFSARSTTAMPPLWRAAVRQGLMLPAWRREYTPWYVAGATVAVGYCVAVALGEIQRNLTFWVGIGAVGLGLVALWRPKLLVGYEFDPRTAAGLRAAELARTATGPDDGRYRTAVRGIRSASDLRAGAPDRHRVPISRWHVPWYARRVREQDVPWWQEVAQATTNYADALGQADGGHGDRPS
jgi:uncharacterized protein (TIGR04222 family)